MAQLYCNGGNRYKIISIKNNIQNNYGGYRYGCSMPSLDGIFSNLGPGIYTGCACNGGWSWSAFTGNLLGNLFGNWFVNGLNMPWGGNNGLFSGIGYTSGSTQGQKTTGNNGKDLDYEKINDLTDDINKTLKSARTNCTLDNDYKKEILQVTLNNYRKNIKKLSGELDGIMDDQNERQLDYLKAQINELDEKFGINSTKSPELWLTNNSQKDEKKSATPVAAKTSNDKDAGTKIVSNDNSGEEPKTETFEQEHKLTRSLTEPNINWNTYDDESMIPSNWVLPDDYTQPKAEDINDKSIIKVEDTSKKTDDISVNTCEVSVAGNNTKNFPATLKITSNNGKTWYYHYAGERAGCPVYITPSSDSNKNVYVLCKQGDSYKLMQFEGFSGYSKGDHQNNNK